MDRHTPTQRSYNMSRIKSKNTKPELLVFRLLKERGYKFSKHAKIITGKPDIVFRKHRVVVFVDGEFWHGKNFQRWKSKLSEFWHTKITANIERDKKNTRLLKLKGWTVIRLWDKAVIKNPERSVEKIIRCVEKVRILQEK
ncbi:MAG: very short patch repair endonuclease [Patescibacteria group bacterium]